MIRPTGSQCKVYLIPEVDPERWVEKNWLRLPRATKPAGRHPIPTLPPYTASAAPRLRPWSACGLLSPADA